MQTKPTAAGEQEQTGIVFVHGAGLASGIWSKVAEGLDRPCLLADYPFLKGGEHTSRQALALDDYISGMKGQLDRWKVKRFVIVAHSIGGVLAQRLAADQSGRLAGFVGVGAAIPKNGGSFLSVLPLPKRFIMSMIMRKMGTKPPESAIRTGLCNDLTSGQAEKVARSFIPESLAIYTSRIEAVLPEVPKLYVKLLKDKEFGQSLQNKMIANLSPQTVATLETGHLPMISDPEGLQAILQSFMFEIER
ncbi:alpha/beta fold hydrolase [Paenibacillus spongiae]|uniref:Alpha/beta hydrolase n=1 Tax=Paenibacillus spongiae TaxID=2909671 RepID=A0ABY5SAD7_9BACL|nr:alpha/beta hydrolase [Paenibacillus spongiae]UVI29490.1 alpha/beta hydrolase [Paenibacillus spongiae]